MSGQIGAAYHLYISCHFSITKLDCISGHFSTAYCSNIHSHFRPTEMASYLTHFGVHISIMYFFCINYQISKTHCLSYIDGIGNHISIADLIKKLECIHLQRLGPGQSHYSPQENFSAGIEDEFIDTLAILRPTSLDEEEDVTGAWTAGVYGMYVGLVVGIVIV
jgi:hypothetical protein